METLSSFAETVIRNLWAVSWQVSILVAIIWIVDRLSRRSSSVFRYWLWGIVLFRLLIPVNIAVPININQFIQNRMGIGIPSISEVLPLPKISDRLLLQRLPLTETGEPAAALSAREQAEQTSAMTLFNITGIFWFAIVVILSALIIARVLWVSLLLKKCTPVARHDLCSLVGRLTSEIGIPRPVGLYYMDINTVDIPAVIGIIRPRIFLPRKIADKWPLDDLEPILLHELAHVKRSDLIINWLQVIVQVVYFFHPLVWYANRRIRQVREDVCDDIAVNRIGTDCKRYTLSILRVMEETLKEPIFGFIGIGFTERNSTLERRVKRIMSKNYKLNQKLTIISIVILMFIGITGILFSCEQSPLKEINDETVNLTAKDSGPGNDLLTDNQLTHIKYALSNPKYPDKYAFNVRIATAWGEQLHPSEELLNGVRKVTEAVEKYTYIDVEYDEKVLLDSQALFDYQIIFFIPDRNFSLTTAERKNLENYFRQGGFAVIDNCSPTPESEVGETEASLRKMLEDVLGTDTQFRQISNDHHLYHCCFDFLSGPPMGLERRSYIEEIFLGDRAVSIFSNQGFSYKWKEVAGNQPQLKFGLNMVVWGFLQHDEIIQNEFISKSLPEIEYVNINLKILEDGKYEIDGVPVTSADLERALKERIGDKDISDYVITKVTMLYKQGTPSKLINDLMGKAFRAGASGVGTELLKDLQSQEQNIKLNTIKFGKADNIKEGSVHVLLDGKPLTSGTDYIINHQTKEIILYNEKKLSPAADLVIRYEIKKI
ncbi:M56 family metallopeptidase [Candidatus Latescibacterota bacterium]